MAVKETFTSTFKAENVSKFKKRLAAEGFHDVSKEDRFNSIIKGAVHASAEWQKIRIQWNIEKDERH